MRKINLTRLLVSIGLLLFLVIALPEVLPSGPDIAYATTIEKEKTPDYKLNLKSIPLVKGKTFALKVYNTGADAKVSFKSADPSIASVNDTGEITANKVGSTSIEVTVKSGDTSTTLTCDVIVGPPAFSVKMAKTRIILGLNSCDTLSVTMKPLNTTESAKFSSYDPTIASVSASGRITAKNLGLTYLFAEIDAVNDDGSRKFDKCMVIVTSTEQVALFEEYFDNHPELNMVPVQDLRKALEEFFNGKADDAETEANDTAPTVEQLSEFLEKSFDLEAIRKAMKEMAEKALQAAQASLQTTIEKK
jgi:hypothetical protein